MPLLFYLHLRVYIIVVFQVDSVCESMTLSLSPQNLAEAEYAVALFMYMRLQGYPPERIAILTTYNGQKHLLRDVLNKRCANNPVFGLPEKVCTVPHFTLFVGGNNMLFLLQTLRTILDLKKFRWVISENHVYTQFKVLYLYVP